MPQLLGRWRPFRLHRLVFRRGLTQSFLRAAMNPSSPVVPQAAAAVPGAVSASARGRVFRLARHALPLRHAAHLDREQRHEPPAPGPHASHPAQPPNPRGIGSQGGFFFCSGVGADRVSLDTPPPPPPQTMWMLGAQTPCICPNNTDACLGARQWCKAGLGLGWKWRASSACSSPGCSRVRPACLPDPSAAHHG